LIMGVRFGAMNFPIKPFLEEIEGAAGLGMDYIELAMDPPEAHFSRINAQAGRVREWLKRYNLGIVCHMPTFVYTADLSDGVRQASVQEVIRSMECAADLGVVKAVLHPGYCTGMAVHLVEQARVLAMESLAVITRRAATLGIRLCFENLFAHASPFVEPHDFNALFEAFPEAGLTLDTGHANIADTRGRRVIAFIESHGARLSHVHLSDNSGMRDEHLPIGKGSIDFKAVARALKGVGYEGDFTLEVFGPDKSELIDSRRLFAAMLGLPPG